MRHQNVLEPDYFDVSITLAKSSDFQTKYLRCHNSRASQEKNLSHLWGGVEICFALPKVDVRKSNMCSSVNPSKEIQSSKILNSSIRT